MSAPMPGPLRVIGRYALYAEIAAGGMATVHFGRLLGPAGFARTIAIKRLHAQFAKDPEFVSMFLDEARLAARIRHPNVVPTLDVVAAEGELFVVMEYVSGESLAKLVRSIKQRNESIPPRIAVTIMAAVLHGLHAAHEAKSEQGEPLGLVHRDVSPQNVLVGVDGVARVLDFGVAKASGRVQTTRDGQLKGKLAYMPVEQIKGGVTRRTDVYAAAAVLWEALTGLRLFVGDNEAELMHAVLYKEIDPPGHYTKQPIPAALDEAVLKGLARDPEARWATAREMAIALERAMPMATASEIGEWVEANAGSVLQDRADKIAVIESSSTRFERPELPAELASSRSGAAVVPIDRSDSQLSSVSVEAGPMSAARTKQRRIAVFVAAAVALVAVLVVFFAASRGNHEQPQRDKPPSLSAAAPTASLAATPTTVATPAPTPTPTPAPAPTPSTTPTQTPSSKIKQMPTTYKPMKPTPAAKPVGNCDPPYSIDPKGKKIYKPECI